MAQRTGPGCSGHSEPKWRWDNQDTWKDGKAEVRSLVLSEFLPGEDAGTSQGSPR